MCTLWHGRISLRLRSSKTRLPVRQRQRHPRSYEPGERKQHDPGGTGAIASRYPADKESEVRYQQRGPEARSCADGTGPGATSRRGSSRETGPSAQVLNGAQVASPYDPGGTADGAACFLMEEGLSLTNGYNAVHTTVHT